MSFSSGSDIDRRGLREHVYDAILRTLLDGGVEPGGRLSIDTIARELDVSPTPVREALVMLERTGLVTRVAQKGYRMAPALDDRQLDELFEARILLEVEATRLAFPHRGELIPTLSRVMQEHEERAEHILEIMGEGGVPPELTAAYFDIDGEFHNAIFGHAGNRYVSEMYETLGARSYRMRQAVVRGVHDVRDATAEHRAILDAFVAGDQKAVTAAMRTHIENVRRRSLEDNR
ncbi:GntR family transcriptional regulator [Agromyces silvae]|uniref:GntR family transcriptional regulator n=1 Tax=Agromyces silvae TaxID=3388266 RepID=UPI00280A915D|nr:GntR family transcriptional regulator [Agromyces protaetiae]